MADDDCLSFVFLAQHFCSSFLLPRQIGCHLIIKITLHASFFSRIAIKSRPFFNLRFFLGAYSLSCSHFLLSQNDSLKTAIQSDSFFVYFRASLWPNLQASSSAKSVGISATRGPQAAKPASQLAPLAIRKGRRNSS